MMTFRQALLHQLREHGQIQTAVLLDGPSAGSRLIWADDQIIWSSPDLEEPEPGQSPFSSDRLTALQAAASGQLLTWQGRTFFVEKLVTAPRLVILGGGHVSLPVSQIGKILDFRVTVVDDRPEFANQARFAWADEIICADFADAMARIPDVVNSYYVILTRGHVADELCVQQLLLRESAYLGMIGSKAKVARTRARLLEKGFSARQLASLHAPIGLDIGGENPAEIAVSIAAEIVQTRNRHPVAELPQSFLTALETSAEPAIQATILAKSGSSPRGVGSRMLVVPERLAAGTIGGGAVEHAALRKAWAMLAAGQDFAVESYDLSDAASATLGMICGGQVRILFERI